MLKDSPPSDLFPLVRSHSVSSQSLRSPPIFAGDGSAGAAYPEIRRQANLPRFAVPVPPPAILLSMPAQTSAPRPFRWRREASPRIQRFAVRRISPLGRTRSASRHPSLYARPASRSPPLSLAARSVAAYPKDSPSGESPRFGWGGLSRRGPAPSSDTPAPLPRPAFPATLIHPRGRVSGGGAPLPTSHRARRLCRRARGDFRIATGTPSPALFAPAAPSVPPPPARRKSLPFRPRTCARRSRVRVRDPRGPARKKGDDESRLPFFGKRAPPGNGPSSVSGTARQRAYSVHILYPTARTVWM